MFASPWHMDKELSACVTAASFPVIMPPSCDSYKSIAEYPKVIAADTKKNNVLDVT